MIPVVCYREPKLKIRHQQNRQPGRQYRRDSWGAAVGYARESGQYRAELDKAGNEWPLQPPHLTTTPTPALPVAGGSGKETDMRHERAELGIDGNCGFALIGENLQAGESEFVEIALPIEACKDPKRYQNPEWAKAAERAATQAYLALKKRLADREITYCLGPSHPRYLP